MKQIYLIIFLGLRIVSFGQNKASKLDDSSTSIIKKDSISQYSNKSNLECSIYNFNNAKERADTLIKYFKLSNDKDVDKQICDIKIFCSFPNSFKEMQELFGFDDSKGAAPLYDSTGENIIKYFRQLTTIPKDKFYDKYINICIEGIWQADLIGEAFGIYDKLINDTEAVGSRLKIRTDKEIISVIRFIFDGPHPDNKFNKDLYNKILPKIEKYDKRLSKLLTESYIQIIKEVHCEGH